MSFLSSIFCCSVSSDEEGESRVYQSRNNQRPRSSASEQHLSKTQSNIQKALSNRSTTPSGHNSRSTPEVLNKKKSMKSSPESNKTDKDAQHHESATTAAKSTGVHEFTDSKDSSDSSKDTSSMAVDEDEATIHNNESGAAHAAPNGTATPIVTSTSTIATAAPVNSSSPISNLNSDADIPMIDADQIYESELDLTTIQPGQVVASSGWLLNPPSEKMKKRKCLVLDLDETLVHSSFKYVRHSDFVIPVEIENQIHNVYVIKRPGVDEFLKMCGELFEVVVFTASVSRYGDPLLDILDSHKSIHHRLFRESCFNYQGNYIKNLSQMGRPLEDLIIIDNSPASYIFHPQHSVPISSWFSDTHDSELRDLIPFLEDLSNNTVQDVSLVLDINI
ncbi:unnamed protein product [Kuraishia capsulata CBS 1993]|uniref:FCP1 homology domain-containing protein n=1 Tax=Kuraishia capsulata CBS 1993 TaxID=1382522 RepID=W6MHG0_9ASCO|nr:uncharacterized protein KUCA_T00001659001 [Kuraishia capsulata CBS 1993]CDK25689.1 unnamed protein product [Kuraishia capsulata CBS 1993]